MTLFKQIALSITLFLFIILGTVIYLNFKSSQEFVQNQLHSNAEDTAASLALALGGVVDMEKDTRAEMQTMISAIYDRGYYESITLTSANNKVLIKETQSVVVKDVPTWFIDNVALDAKAASSGITAGWNTFGMITVKNHVGHAYMQLWKIFVDLLETFAVVGLFFLFTIGLLLKIILRSLSDIAKQAIAIQESDFIINEKVPFTTEFRHVTKAMNSMVTKVKSIFDKEAESLKKYHELLYTDTSTKLFNRRYLMVQLSSMLKEESESRSGVFILSSFEDMKVAKNNIGYEKLEAIINVLATSMLELSIKYDGAMSIRMNSSDFAIWVPQKSIPSIKDDLELLVSKVVAKITENGASSDLFISTGCIEYSAADSQKTLFSKTDFVLAKSKMRRDNSIEYQRREETSIAMGKEEWINMIDSSLEENMLKVASQSVYSIGDRSTHFHEEIYLRMIDRTGKVYNAGFFMPILINLNLTDNVDKYVIDLTLSHIKNNLLKDKVAINIAAGFLNKHSNIDWLQERLKMFHKESKKEISFEASMFSVIKNERLFVNFISMLKVFGYKFGIDNFSICSKGLNFLQNVKPHYIKASASMFLDLTSNENSNMADSLSILAKSMDIKLIATAVENEEDVSVLEQIGVGYIQGSLIGEPQIVGM